VNAFRAANPLATRVGSTWDESIVPVLTDYIRIPALSPAFDPDWASHGFIGEALTLLRSWAEAQDIDNARLEVVSLPGRTPVLLLEIPPPGESVSDPEADTVLLYGHLDKQPEMTGWREGLGPWTPVRDGDRLYGRGGADDGYSLFASLCAIQALRSEGGRHARCVVLIEASEESGSPDLPAYVELLAPRLGRVSLVVCLDSGCADYDRLWLTTSLRGLTGGVLTVRTTTEGLHSGGYGGVLPSTFRIARHLLDRIEDPVTGRVLLPEAWVGIPAERARQAEDTSAILGDPLDELPLVPGVRARDGRHNSTILLDRTWRPTLEVIGADGLPSVQAGGNVLRPFTSLSLSMRLPPTAGPEAARDALARRLTEDPPYGADVRFDPREAAPGWNAPETADWLAAAVREASATHFGNPAAAMGEGGTIPFMGMLGKRFPTAQFMIVGVLGPGSNAHGPNEFLHVPTGKRLTVCVADVLAAHASR
jgi:acetylornithine deacetylase/succinyl-diaminopimelate desuccinylase-like protein